MLLTAEGRFLEAAAVLGSVTNMAEICTRICPSDRLCEHACILDSVSEPVSIQSIERFLADYGVSHGLENAATAPPNGFKIAVVGSGPGGLACADDLATKGCAVTVFDSDLVPGGLLVNGIPPFKLDRSIVQRRIDLLKRRGVVFTLGVRLWEELTLGRLMADFDAVFLGFDSRKARELHVPGAELQGVVQAIPFLLQKNTPTQLETPNIDVAGKRVVVVGGGDTAMDCLRAAIRYGASEALCVYRRDQSDMPCGRDESEAAIEEGARFVFQATPVAVLLGANNRMASVKLIRTEPTGTIANGRRQFIPVPDTEFEIPADCLIVAAGFDPLPCPPTTDFTALARNDWGGLKVDLLQMTSIPGVFAGGDIVRGPSLVLDAVRDGRRAAEQICTWLTNR